MGLVTDRVRGDPDFISPGDTVFPLEYLFILKKWTFLIFPSPITGFILNLSMNDFSVLRLLRPKKEASL